MRKWMLSLFVAFVVTIGLFPAVISAGEEQEYDISQIVINYSDDDNSGTVNAGDIVKFGTEEFYVVKNEMGTLTLLAKYNLYVGYNITTDMADVENNSIVEISASDNGYGMQNPQAGINETEYSVSYDYAVSKFSYVGNSYQGSSVKEYIDNYAGKINQLYNITAVGRLPDRENLEFIGLMLSGDEAGGEDGTVESGNEGSGSFDMAYPWAYNVRYWSSAYADADSPNLFNYVVLEGGYYNTDRYDGYSGVRAMLEVPSSIFEESNFKLKIAAVEYGNITPQIGNDTITLTITPDKGYRLQTITVNGVDMTDAVSDGKLQLDRINGNITVDAEFVKDIKVASLSIDGVTTRYNDLQAALDAAKAGTETKPATLTLLENIGSDSEPVTQGFVISGGNIIFNLNGKTINNNISDGSLFKVEGNTALEFKNGIINSSSVFETVKDASLKINNGIFEFSETAIISNSNITINKGEFRGNGAGSVFDMTDGLLIINDCTVSTENMQPDGAVFYLYGNSKATIYRGVFKNGVSLRAMNTDGQVDATVSIGMLLGNNAFYFGANGQITDEALLGGVILTGEIVVKHEHIWADTYVYDDNYHWNEPVCGCKLPVADKMNYSAHIYDDMYDTTCNVCKYIRELTPPEDREYTIISGARQEVIQGNDAVFISNAPFLKFQKLQIDGKDIDSKYYSVSEDTGNTKIIVKASYIKDLRVGMHIITVVAEDGLASTTFIVKGTAVNPGEPVTPDDTPTTPDKDDTPDMDDDVPGTGTNVRLEQWIILMLVSAYGIIMTLPTGSKRNNSIQAI